MPIHRGILCFGARPGVPVGAWDHVEAGIGMSQGDSQWIDATDAMPAVSASGFVLTWDGRLDNRDDLLLRLGTSDRAVADSHLVLQIIERWGTDGLKWLSGEWSLAAWNAPRRTLYLARDFFGARPLYYFTNARGVTWSEDLAELVERTDRVDALSDAFAAQFMSLQRAPGITPYHEVRALRPGTCVSFTADGSTASTRLWSVQVGEIRYRDSHAYEEHLRSLWCDALRTRLRTEGIVWAELSGGLDSSSVACMADWLIRCGRVRASGIRLVSHATLQSPEGDERRFIAEVERQLGVRSEIVGVEDSQGCIDPQLSWVSPYALQGVGLETCRRIREGGGRVVFSGRLGDAVMGCQPDNSIAVLEDLARGHILTAFSRMRRWSRATHKPFLEIARNLFAPSTQPAPDTGIGLLTHALRPLALQSISEDLLDGIRASKRPLARMVLGYADGARLDIPYRPPGLVYTYPFAHRPLVEFMLAIPGEELSEPGITRSLMRRAFAGFVPARILRRESKGYYPPAAFRAARHAIAAMPPVTDLEVVKRGWIDPASLQAAIRTLTDGSGATGGDIHCVLRLEHWLRARSLRASIPRRKEVNEHAVLNA